MTIQLKRAYEKPSPHDGYRVLVERFWPRDLDEKHAKIDTWLTDVAPSEQIHNRFGENPDPQLWDQFQTQYRRELVQKHRTIKRLRDKMRAGTLTLVHLAHNPEHSGAAVLKRFLEEEMAVAGQEA
jgi:uncharacterized protein YeaO (DUF488 family)